MDLHVDGEMDGWMDGRMNLHVVNFLVFFTGAALLIYVQSPKMTIVHGQC